MQSYSDMEVGHTCVDRVWIIPLQIHGSSVPEIRCEPKRIVARVEGPVLLIEFVTKDEIHGVAVDILSGHGIRRGIRIDQPCPDVLHKWIFSIVHEGPAVPIHLVPRARHLIQRCFVLIRDQVCSSERDDW
jgi:hypothetical protein